MLHDMYVFPSTIRLQTPHPNRQHPPLHFCIDIITPGRQHHNGTALFANGFVFLFLSFAERLSYQTAAFKCTLVHMYIYIWLCSCVRVIASKWATLKVLAFLLFSCACVSISLITAASHRILNTHACTHNQRHIRICCCCSVCTSVLGKVCMTRWASQFVPSVIWKAFKLLLALFFKHRIQTQPHLYKA